MTSISNPYTAIIPTIGKTAPNPIAPANPAKTLITAWPAIILPANRIEWLIGLTKYDIISINANNPLSKDLGKVTIAKNIIGNNIIIGDGYTDYEVKKHNQAQYFIQFSENINRQNINNHAQLIANDFDSIISFIEDKF